MLTITLLAMTSPTRDNRGPPRSNVFRSSNDRPFDLCPVDFPINRLLHQADETDVVAPDKVQS